MLHYALEGCGDSRNEGREIQIECHVLELSIPNNTASN